MQKYIALIIELRLSRGDQQRPENLPIRAMRRKSIDNEGSRFSPAHLFSRTRCGPRTPAVNAARPLEGTLS